MGVSRAAVVWATLSAAVASGVMDVDLGSLAQGSMLHGSLVAEGTWVGQLASLSPSVLVGEM